MSYYGMIWPSYFDGDTGRAIAKMGGADAQLVGVYLACGHEANMLGLYRLRLPILKVRLGSLSDRRLERAVEALGTVGFADYDRTTEHVWVRQMAHYRLDLDDGPLKLNDKRALHAQRMYDAIEQNPFLGPFYQRYASFLHLKAERVYNGSSSLMGSPSEAPHQAPYQAPLKPEISISTRDQDQDQDQKNISSAPAFADAKPPSPVVLNFPVVGPTQVWGLTQAHLADLCGDYPNLDVAAQCQQAFAWCKANPTRRKTGHGMPRFLVSWLSRATDRGGRGVLPFAAVPAGKGVQTVNAMQRTIQRRQIAREGGTT